MSSIDPTAQLIAVIRQHIASPHAESPARRSHTVSGNCPVAPSRPGTIGELIARRMRAIDPDDNNRSRKAFRIYLECVLLFELGTNLINEPRFYQLVDEVHRTMEQDAELRLRMEEAGKLLMMPESGR